MSAAAGIERLVRRVRRRQHAAILRRSLVAALHVAAVVLTAGSLLRILSPAAVGRTPAWLPSPWMLLVSAGLLGLAVAGRSLLRVRNGATGTQSITDAHQTDLLLGADALLLTAHEIRRQGGPADAMQALVLEQAQAALEGWNTQARALRLSPPRGALAGPALGLIAAAALLAATVQPPTPTPEAKEASKTALAAPGPTALAELRAAMNRAAELTPRTAATGATHPPPSDQEDATRPTTGPTPATSAPSVGAENPGTDAASAIVGLAPISAPTQEPAARVKLASVATDGAGTEARTSRREAAPLHSLAAGETTLRLQRGGSRPGAGAAASATPQLLGPDAGAVALANLSLPPIARPAASPAPMADLRPHQRSVLARYHHELRTTDAGPHPRTD